MDTDTSHPDSSEKQRDAPSAAGNPNSASPVAKTHTRSIKIGSQRDETEDTPPEDSADTDQTKTGRSGDTRAVTAEKIDSYFPTPKIKQLAPALEDEIAAALEGKSLEELIDDHNAATQSETLEAGTRLRATIVKIHREDVFLSLGGRSEGVAPLKHFAQPPEPGTEVEVFVVQLNHEDGLYDLSIPGTSVDISDWTDLAEGVIVEALVTGHNKGGLECEVNKIRGFIPASQVSLFRVEEFTEYENQKLQCIVIESDPERRNLVLSHRAILEREKEASRKKILDELEVGQIREGIVGRIHDFGAFVDIGGIDGLVHVSRLRWDRVNHPSDVLQEGQRIKVKVEKIDDATGKIGLSYRDTTENPWDNIESKFPVGSVVTGTVSRTAKFGAFVRLEPGVEGLIHISELAPQRVGNVSQVVTEGQELQVKVLSVDRQDQRIGLSLKALASAPEDPVETESDESHPSAVPEHKGELKGGTNHLSGGEQFGLNW